MGISRRSFIKAGTVGTATLGVTGGLFSTEKWFRTAAKEKEPEEKIGYTFHHGHCSGSCSMKCTIRNGKLVRIQPNKYPDMRFSTVCLKGLSEIQRIYSPERLRTPLKRVGKRGEGKFVPISWDEALSTIVDKIKETQAKYGKNSILYAPAGEGHFTLLPTLLGTQLTSTQGIDIGIANSIEEATGEYWYGAGTNEITDLVNSKTIINLGANVFETSLISSQFFLGAKEAGAKIITVDPHFTPTAAKSHKWIPIKPGTDAALLLAMISIILENNWYQKEFLQKNTSAPFLIRSDNQKLLRKDSLSDITENDKNPLMVWDENSNSLKPFNEPGVLPRLEGEFTINGLKVKSVFTALKEQQKQYTAEWAAKVTEIKEEDIRELAETYALNGPANLSNGWGGADKFTNSHVIGHAMVILGGLTGNLGRAGGGIGVNVGHYTTWPASLGSWTFPEKFQLSPLEMPAYAMRTNPNSVKFVINTGDTFQQHYGNMNVTRKWMESLDFIVTIELFHTSSVDYSDIVLPACSRFETEEELGTIKITKNHIVLQQKVLDPLFDSKTDFQIEKELAERLGFAQYFPKNTEELLSAQLNTTDPALKGITLEALIANNGVMRLNVPKEPYIKFANQVYNTPSTKFEMYFEKMIESKQPLPVYQEPSEANSTNPLREKYPLQFSQMRSRYRIHNQFFNATWINQYTGGPRIEMNPVEGKKRGLVDGDLVQVFNDRGKVKCRYLANNAIRPGTARCVEGWWDQYMGEGNFQDLTNDTVNMDVKNLRYGPVIPFNDTLVEVKKV